MTDCICTHNPKCKYHEDIAELCPDLNQATIRVINRALNRQRVNFEKAMNQLEETLRKELNDRFNSA